MVFNCSFSAGIHDLRRRRMGRLHALTCCPELNPFHPSLRLHRLKGRLRGLHSVSINLSYRIAIEFLIEGRTIIPVSVGSHGEGY